MSESNVITFTPVSSSSDFNRKFPEGKTEVISLDKHRPSYTQSRWPTVVISGGCGTGKRRVLDEISDLNIATLDLAHFYTMRTGVRTIDVLALRKGLIALEEIAPDQLRLVIGDLDSVIGIEELFRNMESEVFILRMVSSPHCQFFELLQKRDREDPYVGHLNDEELMDIVMDTQRADYAPTAKTISVDDCVALIIDLANSCIPTQDLK